MIRIHVSIEMLPRNLETMNSPKFLTRLIFRGIIRRRRRRRLLTITVSYYLVPIVSSAPHTCSIHTYRMTA